MKNKYNQHKDMVLLFTLLVTVIILAVATLVIEKAWIGFVISLCCLLFFFFIVRNNIHKQYEYLHLSINKADMLRQYDKDIMMEIDVVTWEATYNKRFVEVLGREGSRYVKNEDFIIYDTINPDNRKVYAKAFENSLQGKESFIPEIGLLDANKKYKWFSATVLPIMNNNNETTLIVVKLLDITRQIENLEIIKQKSMIDGLTNLYNKEASRILIDQCIVQNEKQQKHALLAIDLDNFKVINDSLGHLFGDDVLKDIAKRLKKSIKNNEIIGRFGGDEFVVFIKEVEHEEAVIDRAKEIVDTLTKAYRMNDRNYTVSASIGICMTESGEDDFNNLYRKADIALYYSKDIGKSTITLYTEELEKSVRNKAIEYKVFNVKECMQFAMMDNVANYQSMFADIFEILYSCETISDGINLVLETLGKVLGVERIHIFEKIYINDYFKMQYEWTDSKALSLYDKERIFIFNGLGDNSKQCHISGISFSNDILSNKEAITNEKIEETSKSILLAGINNEQQLWGVLGIQDHDKNRVWTTEELDMIILIAKLLFIFILKNKLPHSNNKRIHNRKKTMEAIGSCAYIVDVNNYAVSYINPTAQKLYPKAKIGGLCYKGFMGIDFPCARCPLKGLKKDSYMGYAKTYNSSFRCWMGASASKVEFENKDNVALISLDVLNKK